MKILWSNIAGPVNQERGFIVEEAGRFFAGFDAADEPVWVSDPERAKRFARAEAKCIVDPTSHLGHVFEDIGLSAVITALEDEWSLALDLAEDGGLDSDERDLAEYDCAFRNDEGVLHTLDSDGKFRDIHGVEGNAEEMVVDVELS